MRITPRPAPESSVTSSTLKRRPFPDRARQYTSGPAGSVHGDQLVALGDAREAPAGTGGHRDLR
jgi:hypothetical protein